MAYIQLRNIIKKFGDLEVLRNIDLDIEKGQLVTLLGPSGCGKSTLLRCIAGLEAVTDGHIVLDGNDITQLPPQKRNIGMVFQQYSLFPNMSVEKNVAFGLKIQKVPKADVKRRVAEILEVVGLSERSAYYPSQLSGGQQQRVALARAIVTEPKVLLLDEPLSAIDALLRRNLQVEIRRIQQELNITTIFVTHDQNEAMIMSDMIFLMNNGVIEQAGDPVSLYSAPKTLFAANFIGHYNILDWKTFTAMAGAFPECGEVAIRPEIISISRSPIEKPEHYQWHGEVRNSHTIGNIIRYEIDCDGTQIDVDVLFEKSLFFNKGEAVWISVQKSECIALD